MPTALLISGLGHTAANPHPGLALLGHELALAGYGVSHAAHTDRDAILDSTDELVIGHSLGGVAAAELTESPMLVLLDPVRPWRKGWFFADWDLRPLSTGKRRTLSIVNPSQWAPRSVRTVGEAAMEVMTVLPHDAIARDGLARAMVMRWINAGA